MFRNRTTTPATPKSNHRARWAAFGAAVAVSLGGGLGLAHAAGSDSAASYTAISPCRLADTRSDIAFTVGPRNVGLAAGQSYEITGWGTTGNCVLPAGTTALALNVTALNATDPTFLTFHPSDVAAPKASHLNPMPGADPTPNAVMVALSDIGHFSVFNKNGRVDVIIDVVGYFAEHAVTAADIEDEARTVGYETERPCSGMGCSAPQSFGSELSVAELMVEAPVAGQATVTATLLTDIAVGGMTVGEFRCQLKNNTDGSTGYEWTEMISLGQAKRTITLHHVFDVDAGTNAMALNCKQISGSAGWWWAEMTSTFTTFAD